MDASRSIRSSSRGRTSSERGFVLVAALVIAVLYLGLIELLLMDGARALHEAQRLRSRVVAATLAENAAELAAEQMINLPGATVSEETPQGKIDGEYKRTGDQFVLIGKGTSAGVAPESASVRIQGRFVGNSVKIDYAIHSQ